MKHKGGRPPTPPEEARVHAVTLRFPDRHKATLLRRALERDVTVTRVLLDLLEPTLDAWAKADELAAVLDGGRGGRDHEE